MERVQTLTTTDGTQFVIGRVNGKQVWTCHQCGHFRYIGSALHVNDYLITRDCQDKADQRLIEIGQSTNR